MINNLHVICFFLFLCMVSSINAANADIQGHDRGPETSEEKVVVCKRNDVNSVQWDTKALARSSIAWCESKYKQEPTDKKHESMPETVEKKDQKNTQKEPEISLQEAQTSSTQSNVNTIRQEKSARSGISGTTIPIKENSKTTQKTEERPMSVNITPNKDTTPLPINLTIYNNTNNNVQVSSNQENNQEQNQKTENKWTNITYQEIKDSFKIYRDDGLDRAREYGQRAHTYLGTHKIECIVVILACIYTYVSYTLWSGQSYLGQDDLWSSWREGLAFEEILLIPQKDFAHQLLTEIQFRCRNLENPADFLTPLITFLKEIDNETSLIKSYQLWFWWADTLYFTKIIPFEIDPVYALDSRLERIAYIKNVFLNWVTEYKIAQNTIIARSYFLGDAI